MGERGDPDCAFSEHAVIVISVFAIQHQMMVNASSARLSHDLSCVEIQCADFTASAEFYDAVLEVLGSSRVMDFGSAIGYGVPPVADLLDRFPKQDR